MKKTILKIGLFLALGLTVTLFYSCDKNNSSGSSGGNASKITATNVINSSPQIATAKVSIHWHDDYGNCYDDVIAESLYQNDGFTLELPKTVDDKYLFLIVDEIEGEYTVSDTEAKLLFDIDFMAYDQDENIIGDFWVEADDDESEMMWVYADRNVTVQGEDRWFDEYYNEEYIDKVDFSLKKGWNIVYETGTEDYDSSTGITTHTWISTTKKPSGVNFYWCFDSYYYEGSVKSLESVKSPLSARKNFFSRTNRR